MPDRGQRKINARAPDALHEALERCARDYRVDKTTLIRGGLEMLLEDRGYWPPDGGKEDARAPSLPDEPPEGMVRCRAAVCVSVDGDVTEWGVWGHYRFSDEQAQPEAEEDLFGDKRFAFVTFDVPGPQPPAEVVGVVVSDE